VAAARSTIRPVPASRRLMDDPLIPHPLPPLTALHALEGPYRPWRPWAETVRSATGFELRIELPGLQPDEIAVDVDDTMIRLRGEDFDAPDPLRRGPFEYRAELPEEAQVDGITAALQDGVLILTVPNRPGPAPSIRERGSMQPREVQVA
jgi:HSP20 family molecular chaperone IbpA